LRSQYEAAQRKRKEFARVAELLQPIKSDLTEIEGKRLAYAGRQLLHLMDKD